MSPSRESSNFPDRPKTLTPVKHTEGSPVVEGKGKSSETDRDVRNSEFSPIFNRSKSLINAEARDSARRNTISLDRKNKFQVNNPVLLTWTSPRAKNIDPSQVLGSNESPCELVTKHASRQAQARPGNRSSKDESTMNISPSPMKFSRDVTEGGISGTTQSEYVAPGLSSAAGKKGQPRSPTIQEALSGSNNDKCGETSKSGGISFSVADNPEFEYKNHSEIECRKSDPFSIVIPEKRTMETTPDDFGISPVKRMNLVKILSRGDNNATTNTSQDPYEGDVIPTEDTEKLSESDDHPLSDILVKVCEMQEDSSVIQTKFELLHTALKSMEDVLSAKNTLLRQNMSRRSEEINSLEKQKIENAAVISRLQLELVSIDRKLSEKLSLITDLEDEIRVLKSSTQSSDAEIDHLKEVANMERKNAEDLKQEKSSLVIENESMCEKISFLENVSKEKESSIRVLNDKFTSLLEDTRNLHDEMALFENEHRIMKVDLTNKDESISVLKASVDDLKQKINDHQHEAEKFKSALSSTESTNESLSELLLEAQKQVEILKSQAEEKDLIISGDTQKLRELNLQVNSQKQIIADLKTETKENTSGHEQSEAELIQQVKLLKAQIATAQQKSDDRIQEIAEQLYHQYSKKHEVKVSQLRKNYEMKFDEKNSQIKEVHKRMENLENQLRMEIKEKDYLLSVIERGEDGVEGSTRNKINF